ncbi:uncharacterized protein [Dysidea avara]|uniref:uncharacterized protein isoform X2 n=1 Tax=Dysidea avara TaxID=196820 RepID=UPI003324B26B
MESQLEILHALDEQNTFNNVLMVDYESLKGKQRDVNSILKCKFLEMYFCVIFIVPESQRSVCSFEIPSYFNQQICTTLYAPILSHQRTCQVSDHIVTRIIMFIRNQLKYGVRRAYYYLSTNDGVLDVDKVMDYTGREHVYCSNIKSVQDFLNLRSYFSWDVSDPCKVNVFPVLTNNEPHETVTSEMSGKLMFFVQGESFFEKSVKDLWKQLQQFGDMHKLHVSVTSAFPTVRCEVVQLYPVRVTKPGFYRFSVYLLDCCESTVCTVLAHLQRTRFQGSIWSIKLDKSTKEGEFSGYGSINIAKGTYKVCKTRIRKLYTDKDGKKHFEVMEDDQIIQLINEAKKGGYTMKVRHAKVLFCGASGAGKTSFVRLLKNEEFESKHDSTGLGDTQQIMISRKATIQGTKWVDLNPTEELSQLKLRIHHKLLSKPTPHHLKNVEHDEENDVYSKPLEMSQEDSRLPHAQPKVCTPPLKIPDRIVTEEKLCSKSSNLTREFEEPLPVWDILTLLDTGGQPEFINMLPAVNTSATVTFVVLNMLHVLGAKGFDERVQVHHFKNGIRSYESYPLNYTNKDLIKCLVALLKDSLIKDVPLPDVAISQKGKDSKPGLCFVGTHLDKVKEEDIGTVNNHLEKIIVQLEPSDSASVWNYNNKVVFVVDNTLSGKHEHSQASIVNQIRFEIKALLDKKAVYEVPITWILLELEIRLICRMNEKSFIMISEVEALYEKIIPGCDKQTAEIQVRAAMKFHHMFGILLYFHEVPGMNNLVISDPQWLLTNLTNFVCCSFDGTIVDYKDLTNLKSNGILSKSLIAKINTDSLQGIELGIFLELLKYLNIITPYPTNDSSDYLMLAILDSYKDEESDFFKSMPPLDGVEFVIQFNSGTLPRGVFCCLIAQLVKKAKKWKLQVSLEGKKCVFSNFAMFCTNLGQYIVLHDKITHLEIQVRKNMNMADTKCIHFNVRQIVFTALQHINTQQNANDLKCGFYCKSKPCLLYLNSDYAHGKISLPPGLPCENHGWVELESHRLWCQSSKPSMERRVSLQIKFPEVEGDRLSTSRFCKSISMPTEASTGNGHSQSFSHSISEPAGNDFPYQSKKMSTD